VLYDIGKAELLILLNTPNWITDKSGLEGAAQ
jgi:hypothetical protein